MFDWIKSRFPGRNGKYNVPQRVVNDITEKGKSQLQQDLQHKVQVTVTKNKEINITSPTVEIVEVTSSFKQSPIENFLVPDDEPTSFVTTSFKDFTDTSSESYSPLNVIDLHTLENNSLISECVLVDLIQFKECNPKTKNYWTDSDSGRSSLSCQSSSQSSENLVYAKDNPYHGHTKADSRTSLCLSDSEYSFDSLCSNNVIVCENKEKSQNSIIPNESVYLSDHEYSFDSDSCLHWESHSIHQNRSLPSEEQSFCKNQTGCLSENSICLSDCCLDSKVLQPSNRSYIRNVSKSSVCLSDCNYSFDTDPESMTDTFEDELPTFNPKSGFGLNRWYKH